MEGFFFWMTSKILFTFFAKLLGTMVFVSFNLGAFLTTPFLSGLYLWRSLCSLKSSKIPSQFSSSFSFPSFFLPFEDSPAWKTFCFLSFFCQSLQSWRWPHPQSSGNYDLLSLGPYLFKVGREISLQVRERHSERFSSHFFRNSGFQNMLVEACSTFYP